MATDIGRALDPASEIDSEPEVLPRSLAGNWIAWSADGLRIVAAARMIEEAERLAAEAGESEPILDCQPGLHQT